MGAIPNKIVWRQAKLNRMKHICIECGYTEANNNATSPSICKKCGEQMLHGWDQQLEDRHETVREEDED
jgi:hypothetical protein